MTKIKSDWGKKGLCGDSIGRPRGFTLYGDLTFRPDDDNFNVSDAIMSRNCRSADNCEMAFKVPAIESIQHQKRIHRPHAYL